MNIELNLANEIIKCIEEYDTIMVFRHESPDFDALGCQFGMYHFLKNNFKDKKIYAPGFSNVELAKGLYPKNDVLEDSDYDKFLAIVCDTGNTKRISDQNYSKADKIIKIDHHPNVEPYGYINLVHDEISSCSEVLFHLFESKPFEKYQMNSECAKYLYSGMVGDTARFQYRPTNQDSFLAAAKLVSYDFDMFDDVYEPMYRKDLSNIKAMQYVLNNYKLTEHGVAYYYLDDKALKQLGLDCDEAKMFLSLFAGYDEIKIWVCLVEDVKNNNIRGSVRSSHYVINETCSKYHGGGHLVAAGCRVSDLNEANSLINDLDNLLK